MTIKSSFEEELLKNGILCMTNVGVSMRPLLYERRDVMIIRKKDDCKIKKYDAVLFRRPEINGRGEYVLHRILRINSDGTYWIVGDNCVTGEIVKDENILGVLEGVVRKGKRISVNDRLYRLYVRFWCAPYHIRFMVLKLRMLVYKYGHIVKQLLKRIVKK